MKQEITRPEIADLPEGPWEGKVTPDDRECKKLVCWVDAQFAARLFGSLGRHKSKNRLITRLLKIFADTYKAEGGTWTTSSMAENYAAANRALDRLSNTTSPEKAES